MHISDLHNQVNKPRSNCCNGTCRCTAMHRTHWAAGQEVLVVFPKFQPPGCPFSGEFCQVVRFHQKSLSRRAN